MHRDLLLPTASLPVDRERPLAARRHRDAGTRIALGDPARTVIGGRDVVVMAGPCSAEGRTMLIETARAVQAAGARVLRAGAYKPRTSPYEFRGFGVEALEWLSEARRSTGIPVVTEVLDPRDVDRVAAYADVLQVGARNMQNFALLTEVGRVQRPVLLKRGAAATIREFLHAAEYILAEGNDHVLLCERGVRSFEPSTRNALDIGVVPVLKRETHLPVIVDPSHAAGDAALVPAIARAAVAAGADGLIIEVHPSPADALSDGPQSLALPAFAGLMHELRAVAAAVGRAIAVPSGRAELPPRPMGDAA